MDILVFNCGSSTLKFQLLKIDRTNSVQSRMSRISEGVVNRIGRNSEVKFSAVNGLSLEEVGTVADHTVTTKRVLKWLFSTNLLVKEDLGAVGHRVVHGGDRLVGPILVDEDVLQIIDSLSDLAPLHNEPSLRVIRSTREELGASIPMVVVFDTDFHRTLPDRSSRYPIPFELAEKHHVRRYGFHGIAHRYMVERYAAITSTPLEETKLITVQLGAGCSVTAIENGCSVDTSMGLTPLEGLMMATRSGDVDPSLAGYLARREGVPTSEIENWLNTRSGLLGASGFSQDMKELLEAENRGDPKASIAVEMFCYRIKKYIGSYLAALGGADAVIFGGGIGENSAEVRSRVCKGLEWFGLVLDEKLNFARSNSARRITSNGCKLAAYVIPVDEALVIAQDTVSYLRKLRKSK